MSTQDKFLLWIDDDHQLLDHAVSRLRENGIQVLVESDVDKAIAILRSRHSELLGVLVDLMMDPGQTLAKYPTEGGYETGFCLVDYLHSEGLLDKLNLRIFTNAQAQLRFYPGEGAKYSVKIERKSKYKGVKFLNFVIREFEINV